MPRPLRPVGDRLVYHVINRGNNRAPVFFDDGDYEAFLKAIGGTITIRLDDIPPRGGRPPETSRPSAHPVRIPATAPGGPAAIIRKAVRSTVAADSVASMAWRRPTYI